MVQLPQPESSSSLKQSQFWRRPPECYTIFITPIYRIRNGRAKVWKPRGKRELSDGNFNMSKTGAAFQSYWRSGIDSSINAFFQYLNQISPFPGMPAGEIHPLGCCFNFHPSWFSYDLLMSIWSCKKHDKFQMYKSKKNFINGLLILLLYFNHRNFIFPLIIILLRILKT